MKRRTSKRNSIYIRLLKLLLFAAAVSAVGFFFMNRTGKMWVIHFCREGGYVERANEKYVEDLKDFIREENVSSMENRKLTEWVKRHKPVSMQVYKDDILVYDSAYPYYDDLWQEAEEASYYDWETYYTLKFADGSAVVALRGFHIYHLHNAVLVASLLLSFSVFFLIVMLGIRKSMKYIRHLSGEIEILEGGQLDYEITVRGNDELAALARGIDDMRRSFCAQTEKEARLVRANRRMVTEMSHDLRTPLTSVMIYTEIIKQHKYKDEKELGEYIDRIESKTKRMKQLTDHLFEYSLIAGAEEVELQDPEPFGAVFYDLFSEMCAYLEQSGFQVEISQGWANGFIRVSPEYVIRIFDNITSNIVKYADREAPVRIFPLNAEGEAGFAIENKKKRICKKEDSNNIGLENVCNMMRKMQGRCSVAEEDKMFCISLMFRLWQNGLDKHSQT